MEILVYSAKAGLYWVLFYACYRLLLRRTTFFALNRLYLVGSLLISLALPFIVYPETAPEMPALYQAVSSQAIVISYQPPADAAFSWSNALLYIYLTGVFVSLIVFAKKLKDLVNFIRSGEIVELDDCTLALIDSDKVGSFSFLKWIVINKSDYAYNLDTILRHEMAHIQQKHTLDILFIEVLKIVFWFNPVLLLYKQSLQEVHEFLADETAPDREHYAHFLVSYALNAPSLKLSNHFFNSSQIKSRIGMIYKNRSPKWFRGSYVIIIGLIGIVALLVAGCERIRKNFSEDKAGAEQTLPEFKMATIEGWITSAADKKALPGVAIIVKGTQNGTTTDADGHFTIEASGGNILIISYIGFVSKEFTIKDNSAVLLALTPENNTTVISPATVQEPERTAGANPIQVDSVKSGVANVYKAIPNYPSEELANSEDIIVPEAQIKTLEQRIDYRKVFTVVENQPEFPGGNKAMANFIAKSLKYPDAAKKARVSGHVFISFTVDKEGAISDISILKGIGFGCDQEAVRVVSSFPKWKPGSQRGRAVDVKYNLSINFQIADLKPFQQKAESK